MCSCKIIEKVNYVSPYELVKGKENDSGYDVRFKGIKNREHNCIEPMETALINTGLYLELPDNIEVQVRPKSSLSSQGLLVHFGTVDSGYRGEVLVAMTNLTKGVIKFKEDQKIAQIVFAEKTNVNLEKVSEINTETDRGKGGFGSTGQF